MKWKKVTAAALGATLIIGSTQLLPIQAANVVTDVKLGPVSNSTLQQWSNALTTNEQWFMLNYLEDQSAWKTGYDIIAQSGWLYNPTTKMAYTYETERSLDKKIEYINYNDLGGIICWDAQGDEMNNWTMYTKMKNGLKNNGKEVIAYYGNWMAYGDTTEHNQGQMAQNLPWDQVTCINYAFFGVSDGKVVDKRNSTAVPKYKLVTLDEYVDFGWEHTDTPSKGQWGDETGYTDEKAGVGKKYGLGPKFDEYYHFDQLEEIGKYGEAHPDVRIMLSVGGWTRCHMFHEMCQTAANRKVFIDSCIEFLNDFPHFDGIDLDWEYPGFEREPEDELDQGNPAGPEDTENFVSLVRELRAALDKEFPNEHKYLTTCTASDQNLKLNYLDAKGMEPYVDYMNIMTYDYTGTWESTLNGYNSPIFGEGDTTWCIENSVQWFLDRGVNPGKLNIGCPLYGYGFKNVEVNEFGNPKDLPNPIATGLSDSSQDVEVGVPADLNAVYTFTDGSIRTAKDVHNQVEATIKSGSQYIDLIKDAQGYYTVKGLTKGTAVVEIKAPLDNFTGTVTINVTGAPEPLSVKSIDKSNTGRNYTFTCNASGGNGVYKYSYYVTKGGKVYNKLLNSNSKTYTFNAPETGTYKLMVYVTDGTKTRVASRSSFTVQ